MANPPTINSISQMTCDILGGTEVFLNGGSFIIENIITDVTLTSLQILGTPYFLEKGFEWWIPNDTTIVIKTPVVGNIPDMSECGGAVAIKVFFKQSLDAPTPPPPPPITWPPLS